MAQDDSDDLAERDIRDANDRRHERTEHVENILKETDTSLDDHKYPATSEELSRAYGDQTTDLPNETESLGSVFDRLDDEYDTAQEAREAVYNELTGEAMSDRTPEGGVNAAEANDQRNLEEIDDVEKDRTDDA
ncbi:DUF5789 family protein [Halopelagius longus]|uniref:DUF2795 domain-containing protein n=1 Tax=Halopelagius longus TaxID=1236180 RepID=A0A1H1DKX6_9EURY|nr:hypothetical protein [Halopelagius longus]RDI71355.1 hypothetical protein DWB78_06215 [Halopelagius longus]SDQ76546.1 hypothetical protein SAMN05216278_2441 [Halopelagius longus]